MRDLAKSLAKSGLTTLRLDILSIHKFLPFFNVTHFYGRGHSSSPEGLIHDEDLFVQQTAELLDTLVDKGILSASQRDS